MYPSEFTVSEKKMGQIILVALTAHHTPNLKSRNALRLLGYKCFPYDVPRNTGVTRSESKSSTGKLLYNKPGNVRIMER